MFADPHENFADPHENPQNVRDILAELQNFEFQVQSSANQHNFEFIADVGYRVTARKNRRATQFERSVLA
jgi:hypothetical protein